MNYTDLVNEVLMRLREDTVTTIGSSRLSVTDDPVVDIVKLAVNDAKRTVEDAHQWNALRYDWSITTEAGVHTYGLAGSDNRAIVESVYVDTGRELRNVSLSYIHKKAAGNPATNSPMYWAVNGQDDNGDTAIRLFNTPDGADTVTVHGFKRTADLDVDSDRVKVPATPIIYLAFALASRERGEAGGAQAMELFSMSSQFLKDAIALDASASELDNTWNVY